MAEMSLRYRHTQGCTSLSGSTQAILFNLLFSALLSYQFIHSATMCAAVSVTAAALALVTLIAAAKLAAQICPANMRL